MRKISRYGGLTRIIVLFLTISLILVGVKLLPKLTVVDFSILYLFFGRVSVYLQTWKLVLVVWDFKFNIRLLRIKNFLGFIFRRVRPKSIAKRLVTKCLLRVKWGSLEWLKSVYGSRSKVSFVVLLLSFVWYSLILVTVEDGKCLSSWLL